MSSFTLESSGTKPPLGRSQGEIELLSGQYYSFKIGAEHWPAMVCDEEIVQKYFPENERLESIEPIRKNSCPVVIPGRLQFVWCLLENLEPFDPLLGKVIQETTVNTLLAEAWREAIMNVHKGQSIAYWKKRLAIHNIRGLRRRVTPGSRKRNRSPQTQIPPGYASQEMDDDDEEPGSFLPLRNEIEPKIKDEFPHSSSFAETNLTDKCKKRGKFGVASRFYAQPKTPKDGESQSRPITPIAATGAASSPARSVARTNTPDQSKVIIYVGNPHVKFRCKRTALEKSPFLSKLAVHHPEKGWYIMSPTLSGLEKADFFPIGHYLERGEYEPELLDDETEGIRFEQDLTECQCKQEVIRCGKVYLVAQDLEMPGLQDLTFRKLKALGKCEPHHPLAILCVVEMVFQIGTEDLKEYLLHYLADNFWRIVMAETEKAAQILQNDEELAQGVFKALTGAARLDPEIKDGFALDDANRENTQAIPASSGDFKEAVRADNSENNEGYESVMDDDQEGVEMVRMALRESGEQLTEEEIEKIVREQSSAS
ncbi:hypothetical protein ACLMJK_003032 [Lecanora helva]